MNRRLILLSLPLAAIAVGPFTRLHKTEVHAATTATTNKPEFHTADRCVACHNGLKTSKGEDVSIGFKWRASVMANAARDPYWQSSVRRETIDHPEVSADIQDECSTCHMPMQHLMDRADNRKTEVFARLPLTPEHKGSAAAADGVTCSVCHQIANEGLGKPDTFNGNVALAPVNKKLHHPEYGPFNVDQGHQTVMVSSTKGFVPTEAAHIRDSALCGTCHTLYTIARGPGGKNVGQLPEQMPYLEWLHSDYVHGQTCQECHMPKVDEAVQITPVFGPKRDGLHEHVFVGGNFLLQNILNEHSKDLGVLATSEELTEAAKRTADFLQTRSARVSIPTITTTGQGVEFTVKVENLTGHKLPTAYPSRRVWLHVTVRDEHGNVVFESGALRSDGSIVGNDNDADPKRFEPHYTEITQPDQVEIYEPILKDSEGNVTTGLLSAVGYLKDNRILPTGFDKATAPHDIAVMGKAADDPNFNDKGSLVRYVVSTGAAQGPFHVEAELWYQPIGFRWAHNLAPYKAEEPQRFVGYYESNARQTAVELAHAAVTR